MSRNNRGANETRYNEKMTMCTSRRNILLIACIAALAASLAPGAIQKYSLYKQQRAYAFYSAVLRDAGISLRSVSVNGVRYRVEDGIVTSASSSVPEADAQKVLRLAYEMVAAERSPQFGLAGTDPDELDKQVIELERVQKEQADSLRVPSNKEAVDSSLYPISFLRTLAEAERTRRALISIGSDTSATAYRVAISSAIEAERRDSELFGKAYASLGYKNAKFPLLGGTMTSGNVEKAIAAIRSSADAQAATLSKRNRCFDGAIRACDMGYIMLPIPPAVQDTHDAQAERLAMDIEAIYRESVSESGARAFVALSSSTCLASVAGPYIFRSMVREYSTSYHPPILRYLGDIFFSTSTAPLVTMTNGKVDTPINIQSAVYFYECADNGLDISQVRTVENIANFAKAYPDIAPTEREKLLSTKILHEDDAIAYLRSALQNSETYQRGARRRLVDIALTARNKSAALDAVVYEIWTLGENNLKLIKNGHPFDDSLLYFFGSHSAFPTLFQAYNPSVVEDAVSIYDRSPEALTALTNMMLRYSEHPEYRAEIVRFFREYRQFEYN